MNIPSVPRIVLFSGVCSLAALTLFALSGCSGVPLPPIPVSIPIIADDNTIAPEDVENGMLTVSLPVFCNLFDEEELNGLLVAAGGPQIANLVNISRVELESVTVRAVQGDFSAFTAAAMDLTLVDPNADPIALGMAVDQNGLGTEFELTRDMPLDLLSDLANDECGVPMLHLEGGTPADTIEFEMIANVLVFTQINL